jgi:hypothetical protein
MSTPEAVLLIHDVDRNLGAELFQSIRDIAAGKVDVDYRVGSGNADIQLLHDAGWYRGTVRLSFGRLDFQGRDLEQFQRSCVDALETVLAEYGAGGRRPVLDDLVAAIAETLPETERDLALLMDFFDCVLDAGGNLPGSPLRFLSQFLQQRVRQWEAKHLDRLPANALPLQR